MDCDNKKKYCRKSLYFWGVYQNICVGPPKIRPCNTLIRRKTIIYNIFAYGSINVCPCNTLIFKKHVNIAVRKY
jgi:hypothetical protein